MILPTPGPISAKCNFPLRNIPLAEQSLRRALQLNATLKAASKLLAEVLEKQGKTTQSAAVKQVNQQHQILKEKVVEAYRLCHGEATRRKGPERGEALCKEVLQVDPEHVGAKEFLINRALETGRARWAEELGSLLSAQNARAVKMVAKTQLCIGATGSVG